MASTAQIDRDASGPTQFLLTLDRAEKERWRTAAEQAGLSMAEYVRRAVQRAEEAPTEAEMTEARALAAEIEASVKRMEARLDRTLLRVAELLDPAAEAERRAAITKQIKREGAYLDLDALVCQ